MEIRVAIFEDNTALRKSLALLIDNAPGLLCTGAFSDANRLIKNMRDAEPDVVLMDIHMPGLSGIDAVQIIKAKFPAVHILMQTVFEDNDKIFAALCAGASGYLLKKTAPKKIIEAIRESFAGGAPMTPSVAVKVLNMFRLQAAPPKNEFINLSEREKEILTLLVQANSYKAIAAAYFISIDTVGTHVRHIYEKMH